MTLAQLGGHLIIPTDPHWPTQLDDLGLATPPALWVVGNSQLPTPEQPSVSIVGARAATKYGLDVATRMACELTQANVQVISGGAYGIDAAAHRGALEAVTENEGDTLLPGTTAVIAGGMNNLYPSGNLYLFKRIVEHGGLIVSEVPPSFRPARWRFLERNRILAALSQATIVVEAGMRSGAIAMMNKATELHRVVGAVPGQITSPTSVALNSRIKAGQATLIASATDVIKALEVNRTKE